MKGIFKFICCGNVDDGKSTLIGRILLDSGNVKKDQLEDAVKASLRNGANTLEPAMLLDGLLAEREQQITIDIAHRYFDYNDIRFHILDCPGHKQYTQNMAIATAQVNTAILVIDCTKGIQEQTQRHLDICRDFQIQNLCICLTKCDLITDKNGQINQKKLSEQENAVKQFLQPYHFDYTLIPVSAITGFNVDKVLNLLYTYAEKTIEENKINDTVIFHVRTSKMFHGKRYYYGNPITNTLPKKQKKYFVYPQNNQLTITDTPYGYGCIQIAEQIDITEGDCITNKPIIITNQIKHKTIWFKQSINPLFLKHGTRLVNIVSYTENTLETDKNLLFNNIEDIKANGYGIIIDSITKETIGCCLFTGNVQTKNNTSDSATKTKKTSIRLNVQKLLTTVFNDTSYPEKRIHQLVQYLNEEDIQVVLTDTTILKNNI